MKLPPEIEEAFKDLVPEVDYAQMRSVFDASFKKLYAKIGLHVLERANASAKLSSGFTRTYEAMHIELQEMLDGE